MCWNTQCYRDKDLGSRDIERLAWLEPQPSAEDLQDTHDAIHPRDNYCRGACMRAVHSASGFSPSYQGPPVEGVLGRLCQQELSPLQRVEITSTMHHAAVRVCCGCWQWLGHIGFGDRSGTVVVTTVRGLDK